MIALLPKRFSVRLRLDFYLSMARFISNGMPVVDALERIQQEQQLTNNRVTVIPPRTLEHIMQAMRDREGRTLGAALSPHVPKVEAALISAGEEAGQLASGLSETVNILETRLRIHSAIFDSLFYPVFLLVVLMFLMGFLRAVIVPSMEEIMPRDKWPDNAQILGFISDYYLLFAGLLIFAISGLLTVFSLTANTFVGSLRSVLDRFVVPWNIYKVIQSSTMLTALSLMLKSGTPTHTALQKLCQSGSQWQVYHLGRMQQLMAAGMKEGDAIAGEYSPWALFDPYTAFNIRLAGETSQFAIALHAIATKQVAFTEKRIKQQLAVVSLITLVFVAVLVAVAFTSMYALSSSAAQAMH